MNSNNSYIFSQSSFYSSNGNKSKRYDTIYTNKNGNEKEEYKIKLKNNNKSLSERGKSLNKED